MKKKRKKKTTSTSCPSLYQLNGLLRTTSKWTPSLGSAPDVPNRLLVKNGMQSCLNFAENLFGKEGCQAICGDIQLKSFLRQISEHTVVRWDTVVCGDGMFVEVPLELSRDSFVELLDYAEESLDVTQVIACIEKTHQGLRSLVKSFGFMGFAPVPPGELEVACKGHDLIPIGQTSSYLLLSYEL